MNSNESFFAAIKQGDLAQLKKLLEADASLARARSESGESPILTAIFYGRTEIKEFLLSRGIELDIFEAAATGNLGRVTQLVSQDASLAQAFSSQGFPALALAAFCAHLDIVKFLIRKGAHVNAVARNATGYTALTASVTSGQVEITAALLAAGAQANYRYGQGHSPLHSAAASGNLRLVTLLLDHGGDPAATMDDGQTPISLAESKGHKEVAALLKQRAATA
ncbi:MAG: ankyrin repeat domain-containing protein [Candidatus Acidiferrales bacterium]